MDIFIYNKKKTEFIKLPVLPEKINVSSPQKIETFDAIGLGELKIIGKKGNKELSLSSFFPVKDYPFLKDRAYKGMQYVDKIEQWRNEGNLIIIISELNINFEMVIETFEYGIGTSGDIEYTMSVSEFKPPVVKKVTTKNTKIATTPSKTVMVNKNSYAVVTYKYLNVRSGKGAGYKEVGELKKGDKVKVLDFTGKWWKILYKNKIAYVFGSSKYIKKV